MKPEHTATVVLILQRLSSELARDGSTLSHWPLEVVRIIKDPTGDGCRTCGGPVEPVPIGRPRLHCERCRKPRRKPSPKSDQSPA